MLGLYFYAFMGAQPIGGLFSGWLADTGGTSLAFAVGGAVTLVANGDRVRTPRCDPASRARRASPEDVAALLPPASQETLQRGRRAADGAHAQDGAQVQRQARPGGGAMAGRFAIVAACAALALAGTAAAALIVGTPRDDTLVGTPTADQI